MCPLLPLMAAPEDVGGVLGALGEMPHSPNTPRRHRGREVVVVNGNMGATPITNTNNMANTIAMAQGKEETCNLLGMRLHH